MDNCWYSIKYIRDVSKKGIRSYSFGDGVKVYCNRAGQVIGIESVRLVRSPSDKISRTEQLTKLLSNKSIAYAKSKSNLIKKIVNDV